MTQSGSTPGHFRITWLFQKAQVLGRSQQLCLTLWGIVRGALALLFLKADSTVPLPGVPLTQARATSHFSARSPSSRECEAALIDLGHSSRAPLGSQALSQ